MGSAIGTPQYMSPEQAAGQLDQLGPASDVYSLGRDALLPADRQIAAVGRNDERSWKNSATVQAGDFIPPRKLAADIPKPLEAICLKAMALNQAQRYPSPRALGDDLENWLADEPVTALPDTRMDRASRWARRHRALVRATTAATLIVAAVAIVAAVLIEHQRRLAANLAIGATPRHSSRIGLPSGSKTPWTISSLWSAKTRCLISRECRNCTKSCSRKRSSITRQFIKERADDPAPAG